jgi:ribosomal protein L30E
VSKPHCKSRAEWRLQPGKPAELLSAHYRLDCDFGTAVIHCWEDGGSEPIYVCESHAKQLGRIRERPQDVRIIAVQSERNNHSVKSVDRTQIREVAETRPKSPTPSEAARSLADTKVGRTMADSSVKSPARDITYGNSAKAMVDEAIWNLAAGDYKAYKNALQQGRSAREAAQAAGGQLAVIHRKIDDYALKLEAILSESRAKMNVGEVIDKPLELAMLEIISSGTSSDSEKDAAIQQLGTLQQWVKHGLAGDMSPLQANRIILAIGDRLKWGGTADVSEEFKRVYRDLYGSLKTAICTAVPEAQNLHDRLTNLCAAKSDLEIC